MPGGGNYVRCERYRKTPRTPRSSHARYYYTRSLVIDSRNRPRQHRLRCQSAPKVMDRSHSRSASPREPARPQHRPPSPPSPPPAFDNRAYVHDEYDPNHNDSFTSNPPNQNGHSKEPNGETKALEAVNLELINLTPKNGNAKQKKDVEVDMNASNPYDEYFVPVNEHRKYMRGEKLYVTADKRGEKGGCKRPLCWTLLGLVVAAIVALIVLAATGILFTNSPTPLEPYNASVSSARALGGITHTSSNDQDHDNDHNHDHIHDHGHNHSHSHDNESNTESGERDQTTEHANNQEQENSQEDLSRENQETARTPDQTTAATTGPHGQQMQNDGAFFHSTVSEEFSDSMFVPRTLEGELKIDNEEFTATLSDPESDDYRDFVTAFADALKQALFDRNNVEYKENDISLEVIKIRKGSIVVTYRVHWEPKHNYQTSDNLLTMSSLQATLNDYLAQNNRMISIYHIAEDKIATRQVLDICQINNNDCEYGCEFDKRTLDFKCTCPHGQILDMKQPKKCMILLDNTDQIKNTSLLISDLNTPTVHTYSEEEKPNTESIYVIEKENRPNAYNTIPTVQTSSEITTENDADVNFSHIFGTSMDENVKHVTEMSKQQSESSEEEQNEMSIQNVNVLQPNVETSTISEESLKTYEPTPEPEPTSKSQPDSETAVITDKKQEEMEEAQQNPESKDRNDLTPVITTVAPMSKSLSTFEPQLLSESQNTVEPQLMSEVQPTPEPQPTLEPHPSPEPQPTAEPQPTSKQQSPEMLPTVEPILHQTTMSDTQIDSVNVISVDSSKTKNNIDLEDADNLPTTETLSTMSEGKYDLKSHYNFDTQFEFTTMSPSKLYVNQPSNIEKNLEENSDKTTTENDWLEDTTDRSKILKNELNNAHENTVPLDHTIENNNNQATAERSSKAIENDEFMEDEITRRLSTSQNSRQIETNATRDDLLSEQNINRNESPLIKEIVNEEGLATTVVSISQLFFGKKPDDSLGNVSHDTTTMSILTGIEESRQFLDNETTENNTTFESKEPQIPILVNSSISGRTETTTPITEQITEYSIAKQSKELSIDTSLMTVLKNTNTTRLNDTSQDYNATTEKEFVDGDITFDAINKLYNRSSKSFVGQNQNIDTETEMNEAYRETAETTTSSDWLSETVTEINYQDIINENKNRETTAAPVTKIDEIMSRGMNKDDFEPDYLNMGPNSTKGLEHDIPQYGMLHDYDNEDMVIKRVKNEPGLMIEETTINNFMQLSKSKAIETNESFESTTVSDYIYKMSLNDSDQNFGPSLNSVNITHSVPQVWESTEDDINLSIKELPKQMSEEIATDFAITTLPTTTIVNLQQKKEETNTIESDMQKSNITQGNNLNVNIYEIPSHNNNLTIEKSVNHHSAEYDDRETEMNPFLPEIENNKSLVRKLQEGHDLEPSNVNETQNENTEEPRHNADQNMTSINQTDLSINETIKPLEKNTHLEALDNNSEVKDNLGHQNTPSNDEGQNISFEFNRDIDTTPSSLDQLDDDTKESSDQNEALPITTFLLDTDDLDSTKDPFERKNLEVEELNRNSETSVMPMTLSETTTEREVKMSNNNELLSVVPIEVDKFEGQESPKNNFDSENMSELNQISDSPKKSDRRTIESSNINSLIDNEA